MKSFAEQFKKYRLRSEFETLSSFADAFAQKGLFYELSIFSHWQNGTRVPTNREIVITILTIFIENGGITTIDEANEFLESAGHGYLTRTELAKLSAVNSTWKTCMKII